MHLLTGRGRPIVAVAMLGLALAVVVAVVVVPDRASPDPIKRNAHVRGVVLFVGDSNVTLGATNIIWALTWEEHDDNGYVPIMASRVGASIRTYDCLDRAGCTSTDYWKTRLGELLPKVSPDVVVTNLGVNDTAGDGTPSTPGSAAYDDKIDWFMELVPDGTPVLWSNLPCAIGPPSRAERCAIVNEALAEAPARWSNLEVIDWSTDAAAHPEYMEEGADEVHLTAPGFRAWTALILEGLDARFAVAEP